MKTYTKRVFSCCSARSVWCGVLLLSGVLVLSACAQTSRPDDFTPPVRNSIWSLFLYQGFDRWTMPYYNAAQPFAHTTPRSPDLPLERLAFSHITDDLAWLRDYDLNCDRTIDRAELSQAWLIRLAEIKTGNLYGPHGLLGYTQTAALLPTTPSLDRLTGVFLPLGERVLIRATLEQNKNGRDLVRQIGGRLAAAQHHHDYDHDRDQLPENEELSVTPAGTRRHPAGTGWNTPGRRWSARWHPSGTGRHPSGTGWHPAGKGRR